MGHHLDQVKIRHEIQASLLTEEEEDKELSIYAVEGVTSVFEAFESNCG